MAGRGWNDFIKMFPVRFSGGGPKGRTPLNPAHINNPAPGVSHICSPAPNNHHMINRWRKERTHLCGCKCASSYHSSGGSAFHSIGKDRVSCHCKRRVVDGIVNNNSYKVKSPVNEQMGRESAAPFETFSTLFALKNLLRAVDCPAMFGL